jgi:hypothetical protein
LRDLCISILAESVIAVSKWEKNNYWKYFPFVKKYHADFFLSRFYLKKSKNIKINPKQKMNLGKNLVSSFKAKMDENLIELKKVTIQENGVKMQVIDYPREFFTDKNTEKIISRFLKKLQTKKLKFKKNEKVRQTN